MGITYDVRVCKTCGETFLRPVGRVGPGLYCRSKCIRHGSRVSAEIETIAARYVGGETLQQIADTYGVTREWIRQSMTKRFGRMFPVKNEAYRLERQIKREATAKPCRVCLRPVVGARQYAHDGECARLHHLLRYYLNRPFRESLRAWHHARAKGRTPNRVYLNGDRPRPGTLLAGYWARMMELRGDNGENEARTRTAQEPKAVDLPDPG